jgi:hypothetical protein
LKDAEDNGWDARGSNRWLLKNAFETEVIKVAYEAIGSSVAEGERKPPEEPLKYDM